MTRRQMRQRRVELLIDQRLVGFLKPQMTITSSPMRLDDKKTKNVTDIRTARGPKRGERAS